MLACLKTAIGKTDMVDLPMPRAGPGEIVVKMAMCTVCGSDMHWVDEIPNEVLAALAPGFLTPQGFPMGHEAVGTVHEVGPGVTRVQVGDRVISSCMTGCGSCAHCLRGDFSVCTGGGRSLFGCQAEYFVAPFADVNVAKVPPEVSDENAVLATDIMSTGFGAIDRAGLKFGDSVAIFAQGPLGLCATAGARARGAGMIITVESVSERIEMSKRLGANVVINPKEKDPVWEIQNLTNMEGVDVTVEAVGTPATFDGATRAVRRGGTASFVGIYGPVPQVSMFTMTASFYHRRMVSTLCPSGHDRMTHMLELVRWGRVDLSPLFTHRMKLTDTPKAYDLFRSKQGGVLKIAITP
jgi:threonine dehydrogenase-like Zn-dependent dehydrogenase